MYKLLSSAALAALLVLSISAPSRSESHATHTTQPAAAIIAGKHYMDYATRLCPNADSCVLQFSRIPAGQRVLITNISCMIESAGARLFRYVDLGFGGTGDYFLNNYLEALSPSLTLSNGIATTYTVAQGASFLYSPGNTPAVRAVALGTTSANIYVQCRISGQRPSPL